MSFRSPPPRLAPYGYSAPDPRYTKQGLWLAFVVGVLIGGGLTLLWTARSAQDQAAVSSTELAMARKALSDCSTAADTSRQAYLSERLKLTADLAKALDGCPAQTVSPPVAAQPMAPVVPLQPPQPPSAPSKPTATVSSGPEVVGPPHPKRKPVFKQQSQNNPVGTGTTDEALRDPIPPQASAQSQAPVSAGAVFSLQVGQERSLKYGGVLRLVAISKLNSGQFCVIAGDDGSAVRLPSGRSKSVRLAGYTYKLTASVKDRMSCAVRVE
jgi:hypothetical protein